MHFDTPTWIAAIPGLVVIEIVQTLPIESWSKIVCQIAIAGFTCYYLFHKTKKLKKS